MPAMTMEQATALLMANARRPFGQHARSSGRLKGGAPEASPGYLAAKTFEKRPWIDKPAGGIDFRAQNIAQVNIPAATGTEVTVLTFPVPPGMNGIIKLVGNQAVTGGWVEGTGALVWRIELDGMAVRNFQNIIASLGSVSNPGDFGQGGIRIFENQVVAIILRNVSLITGGSDPVLALLGGWFYPIEQEGESTWF
ncbi:MAG: hypothetical protein V3U28_06725 [Candidatus Acidoferrales bacterium]